MRLTTVAVVLILLVCTGNVGSRIIQENGFQIFTGEDALNWICKSSLAAMLENALGICSSTTTTTAQTPTAPGVQTTITAGSSSLNPLNENDRWCQLQNGTYLPLNYTYMRTECMICQCTQSGDIHCSSFQCMPAYCIDGSKPTPKPGQCCPQCAYETKSTPCLINGITFPHGTILGQTKDNLQCWCQLGNVECRKTAASAFSSLDYFGSGTAAYVIVIVIFIVLLCGTLLCCSGTLAFYYYYKRRQQAAEQSYAEYYNNAGWQPMAEDGQVASDKQAEAMQNAYQNEYSTGRSEEFIPPPYAIYNSSYEHERAGRDGK